MYGVGILLLLRDFDPTVSPFENSILALPADFHDHFTTVQLINVTNKTPFLLLNIARGKSRAIRHYDVNASYYWDAFGVT